MDRDRAMERKRRTAGDKTESESEGGKGGEDRRVYTETCSAQMTKPTAAWQVFVCVCVCVCVCEREREDERECKHVCV